MFKASGVKGKALSPVLALPPISSAREGGQLAAGCPADRAGWAPAECGVFVGFLPGANPPDSVEEFKSSKYIFFSPAPFPEESSSLFRSNQRGSASAEPPLVPAMAKQLRASVSLFYRLRPVLPPHFLKHVQTDALCC